MPSGMPRAMPQSSGPRSAPSYRVLYRFDRDPNGEEPLASLINVHGTLYGTTYEGGAIRCHGRLRCGTVYTITRKGVQHLLYSFRDSDGRFPAAPLVDVNGTLYGTTAEGGLNGKGTIYSINASGSVTVLHSFHGGSDGWRPWSGLIDVKGTLYGTTLWGGRGGGTVYSISPSGAEKVLYRFNGRSDGFLPQGGLIDVNGTLYGTTVIGGGSGCGHTYLGCGTIYRITTKGIEQVVYRFTGGSDGESPGGSLVDVNGVLYGATAGGGANGTGTIYSFITTGTKTELYSFAGGSDGADPAAGLIDVKGMLYGTTVEGGGAGCGGYYHGCGTVYSISTAGAESVLYRFAGGSDGMSPQAPLVAVKDTLYGTTAFGGAEHEKRRAQCCGTIFALQL